MKITLSALVICLGFPLSIVACLHPDTDTNFWDGYIERPALKLPTRSVPDVFEAWQRKLQISFYVFVGAMALLPLAVGWLLQRRLKVIARITGKI